MPRREPPPDDALCRCGYRFDEHRLLTGPLDLIDGYVCPTALFRPMPQDEQKEKNSRGPTHDA